MWQLTGMKTNGCNNNRNNILHRITSFDVYCNVETVPILGRSKRMKDEDRDTMLVFKGFLAGWLTGITSFVIILTVVVLS